MNCVAVRSRFQMALCGLLAVSSLAALAGSASAQATDFTYGGNARAFGMGGAGIALMQTRTSRDNPATLAFENRAMDPTFPTLGLRATGPISKDSAGGYILGGSKNKDALALARQFGGGDSEFGVNGIVGFRVGQVEIGGYAVGTGKLQANASLQRWVNTANEDYSQLPQDARADIYAAGYYSLPSIAVGKSFNLGKSSAPRSFLSADNAPVLGVGVRLKMMNAVYSHYVGDYTSLLGLADAKRAPEMGGSDTLTRRGFGADLGFMVRPRNGNGISGALVVANAVKPNFNFDGTDRDGNPTRVSLLRTTFSAGMGYENRRSGVALAADVVDLTSAAGPAQMRVGVEKRLWGPLSVRTGFNSDSGVTYGLSFFGVDAAFGKRLPLEVVRTMRF